ncbi:MAG: DUF192 domain-containing protein [Methanobacteriota archaeon]
MTRKKLYILLALVLTLGVVTYYTGGEDKNCTQCACIERNCFFGICFSSHCINLEIVSEALELEKGLMNRDSLPTNSGMLFVFDIQYPYTFWMKNVRFPIDMIWLDENGTVVHIEQEVPPCRKEPCPLYTPSKPALYVLEVNSGETLEKDIKVGSKLKLDYTTNHPYQ